MRLYLAEKVTASRFYQQHLKSSGELATTYEAVRAGFVALALEKNRRATPLVAQARALKSAAALAESPVQLAGMEGIRSAMLSAAGVSEKASGHLSEANKSEAISELIKIFLEPAGPNFVEELVFRFLLTKGDALGGAMRNVGGFMAQRKLNTAIIACLRLGAKPYCILAPNSRVWSAPPQDDADSCMNLRGISWGQGIGARTLVFNLTVPMVGNNVDLCLLACSTDDYSREVINSPLSYLALGELKGGIDPAGADEHWKTARTALERIRRGFAKNRRRPQAFFIGAAIEEKMATEIWQMLRNGALDNAANLTSDDQLSSIARWLCSL